MNFRHDVPPGSKLLSVTLNGKTYYTKGQKAAPPPEPESLPSNVEKFRPKDEEIAPPANWTPQDEARLNRLLLGKHPVGVVAPSTTGHGSRRGTTSTSEEPTTDFGDRFTGENSDS